MFYVNLRGEKVDLNTYMGSNQSLEKELESGGWLNWVYDLFCYEQNDFCILKGYKGKNIKHRPCMACQA